MSRDIFRGLHDRPKVLRYYCLLYVNRYLQCKYTNILLKFRYLCHHNDGFIYSTALQPSYRSRGGG